MLMRDRRITQAQLAARLGLAQSAVSARLRGETRFSIDEVEVIADLLGVTINDIVATPAVGAA